MDIPLPVCCPNSSTAILYDQSEFSPAVCDGISAANKVVAMKKRRDLTAEEKAEAGRLKAVYEARKREARSRGESLTQESVGAMCGWESPQSAVNQYLNGRVPLNLDALLRFSAALVFAPAEVSPRLASGLDALPRAPSEHDVNIHGDPIKIKQGLVPVVGRAQLGVNGYFEEMGYPPGGGDGYLKIYSDDPDAYALRLAGSSMEPRIRSGEFVVIEPGNGYVAGDEVLVRTADGQSMIKVFMYHRDGEVRLLSVNDAHPPLTLAETEITHMHPVGAIVKASRLVEL